MPSAEFYIAMLNVIVLNVVEPMDRPQNKHVCPKKLLSYGSGGVEEWAIPGVDRNPAPVVSGDAHFFEAEILSERPSTDADEKDVGFEL